MKFALGYFLTLYRINRHTLGCFTALREAYRTAFAPLPF